MRLKFHLPGRVGFFCLVLAGSLFAAHQSKAQSCQTNNFAANQLAVASDGNDMAGNVVDGNLTTDWYGGADSKWLYVDLGSSKNLCKVTLKMGLWSTITQTDVQGSNDASSWTTLSTIAAGTSFNHVNTGVSANDYDYFDVDLSNTTTAYRYVRLSYPSNTSWGPHLKELEVYVKAQTLLPTVNITAPDAGSNFIQGNNITVTANASEQGGSISKVEFYQGSTKLGESTTAPYQFVWNNVQSGDYTLVAKAYDGNNQTATSSVEIWVDDPLNDWSLNGNSGVRANSFIGTLAGNTNPLIFKTNGVERLRIMPDGRVGIKTSLFPTDDPNVALAVDGSIYARKLKITQATWADFVFNKNYRLRPIGEVEKYINRYHHLPDLPSASKVESKGLNVGDNQAALLQKIEELTLYVIQLNKEIEKLKDENAKKSPGLKKRAVK